MKTKQQPLFFFARKISHVLVVLTLLCIISIPVRGQESTITSSPSSGGLSVYPTFGFGIGFFYPSDVNDYIAQDIVAGNVSVNTDIYMYLEIKGGLTFRLKKVDFNALIEYDMAPKFITVSGGGDDFSYSYNRFSPEISANYYISNKSGRNAFFVGAGINYSFMKFEEFSAAAPGFKVQLGYSMQFGKFNLQPYGAFRYSKATDSSDATWGSFDENSEITLDYIGGQIGVILSFHQRKSYK